MCEVRLGAADSGLKTAAKPIGSLSNGSKYGSMESHRARWAHSAPTWYRLSAHNDMFA